jgi:hypothetical protein
MNDGLEIAAGLNIGKHEVAELAAIERTSGVENCWPESGFDGLEAGCPRRDRFTRQHVRVDGRDTERSEHREHVALASGDSAGQCDSLHERPH